MSTINTKALLTFCAAVASQPVVVNREAPTRAQQDPTGQASNRNRGTRILQSKLTKAERRVKAEFRAIPRTRHRVTQIVNADQLAVYDYDYPPEEQAATALAVAFILNDELLETQTELMPFDWYWKPELELPFRQGTVSEVRDFNTLVAGAIAAGALVDGIPPRTVDAEQILFSQPYRTRLAGVQISGFQDIKTLSERTASQVMQQINAGIEAGKTPTAIAADITKRFDVAKSSAKRIAVTEVNKAFNDAEMATGDALSELTGLRTALLHISALLPTTRAHHAARHGNAYTRAAQEQWWNSGANRINCHCSTKTVLIDSKGNVVNTELQSEIKAERKFFDPE